MKRIGTLKGIPIVEGNSNELKKNNILCNKKDGNIELSKRENGQVSNISGGGSNINNNIYVVFNNLDYDIYIGLCTVLKIFGLESNKYTILEGTFGILSTSDYWEDILTYGILHCKGNFPKNDTGRNYITYNSLEEFEQLFGLDSNNRPFKIITEEEFYKDLTEEEARKIASEL